ncbi:MAG TPA: S8 family peptidase [Gemmatimonadaceae bacterium]|jgi:hypothetical protein
MPDRPLLLFPAPTEATRSREFGGGRVVIPPSPERQRERLERKFVDIARGIRDVAPGIDGFEPERVVVFEAAGDLTDVAKAADRIPGLEWLREVDLEGFDADEDFRIREEVQGTVPQRLFALMSTQGAIDSLLGLWNDWQAQPNRRAPTHFGPFKNLFKTLKDIRQWSARDRVLDTHVEEYWVQNLEYRHQAIRFEAELWYRSDARARRAASLRVETLVIGTGGRKIDEAVIDGIRYHALLLECPRDAIASAVEALRADQSVELLRCEEVMFFRPLTQSVSLPTQQQREIVRAASGGDLPTGTPVIALLDGVPLERHVALDRRMVIDDPDDYASSYLAEDMQHGTAMASLIIHGEAPDPAETLKRPVYVRPVMKLETNDVGQRFEQFPSDRLFLDVFHRAIRRMMVGDGETPAVAPSVRVVNVSLGNHWQPFVRELSPLAKLLDWLAWEHQLLFIVSAGNFPDRIILDVTRAAYEEMPDRDAIACALRSLRDTRHERRLIAPAESVNALTVGALNADASGQPYMGNRVDLMRDKRYPSPITRLGLGLNHAVKPEVLAPGGRQLYTARPVGDQELAEFEIASSTLAPGNLVATSVAAAGDRSAFVYSRGTSNAAALTTRLGAKIYDRLEDAFVTAGIEPDYSMFPVMIKALLVHSSSWSDPDSLIASLCVPGAKWQEKKRLQSELMGFGMISPERALNSTDQRVLLIGFGRLSAGRAHRFSLPLPDVINGQAWRRRLVATVAWLTPLHFRHRKYRRSKIFLSGEEIGPLFGPATDADDKLAGRGTVQHLVRTLEERRVVDDDFELDLQVNCRADAGDEATDIPYGFAATLEVAAPVQVSIYDAIRDRIRDRIREPLR